MIRIPATLQILEGGKTLREIAVFFCYTIHRSFGGGREPEPVEQDIVRKGRDALPRVRNLKLRSKTRKEFDYGGVRTDLWWFDRRLDRG